MTARALLLLCLGLAGFLCFRTAHDASQLPWNFDEPFYVTAARNVAREGRYVVRMFGREHPPIYPPAFPVFVLAPLYRLWPHELGVGVYGVLATALAAVALAFRIGGRLGGPFAAVGAACGLLWLGDFRRMAANIMSDVPSVCALLGCCVASMELRGESSAWRFLGAGLVFAVAAAVRVLNIVVLGPALVVAWRLWRGGEMRAGRLLLVVGPVAAVLAGGMVRNATVFGAPLRNAYHYWAPFPHEVGMSFGPEWVVRNVGWLLLYGFPAVAALGLVGLIGLRRLRVGEAGALDRFLLFLAMVPGVHSALFLFYSWSDMRLHLALLAFLAVAGGAGVGAAVGRLVGGRVEVLGALLFCAMLQAGNAVSMRRPAPAPRRAHLDQVRTLVPADAVLVVTMNPLIVEAFVVEGTRRIAVPLDRRVELMDRPIAPRPIGRVEGLSWADVPGAYRKVLAAGAEWPVEHTAAEHPQQLAEWLARGRSVWLETGERAADDASVAELRKRFSLREAGPGVFEVTARR